MSLVAISDWYLAKRMLQGLKQLVYCLNETLDPERFAEIELLDQYALKWQEA
jgi:hypothetical protein